jgi:membrane-associated phospholipid phosphatase
MGGLISTWTPIVIIVLAQIRIRSFWDMNNAIMGLLYSLILGTLFQVTIKILIGGFRPYFLVVCQPDISRAATHDTTGLNGVGFHQLMYSADVCTNPDKGAVKGAMTSFPSGHSTAAFASGVFLFLWMNAKLKVWTNYQTSFWWLALLFAPLLGAVLQACLLTIDMAHNWYDILVGSIIGTMFAFASYRLVYASIFDWRYNHIPLSRTNKFDYVHEIGPDYMERDVFVRKMGWGRKRRTGRAAFAWRKKKGDAEILDSPDNNATLQRREKSPTVTAEDIPPPVITQAMQDQHGKGAAADQLV